MKKFIPGVAAALALALSVNAFALSSAPFADLEGVPEKAEILELQEKGFVKGFEDGTFAPDKPITMAQGVQLIVNALDINIDNVKFIRQPLATDYFPKADNSAWYADALIIAGVCGLELPKDSDPDAEWTREAFAFQLVRAMEASKSFPMLNLVPVPIVDEADINPSYSGAIQRAIRYGIVALDENGKFNPRGKMTRAGAAFETAKALEYLEALPAPVPEADAQE